MGKQIGPGRSVGSRMSQSIRASAAQMTRQILSADNDDRTPLMGGIGGGHLHEDGSVESPLRGEDSEITWVRKWLKTGEIVWLGGRDSNPDNLLQRQMSYRWTTSQCR